jgi:hypothetical protein
MSYTPPHPSHRSLIVQWENNLQKHDPLPGSCLLLPPMFVPRRPLPTLCLRWLGISSSILFALCVYTPSAGMFYTNTVPEFWSTAPAPLVFHPFPIPEYSREIPKALLCAGQCGCWIGRRRCKCRCFRKHATCPLEKRTKSLSLRCHLW